MIPQLDIAQRRTLEAYRQLQAQRWQQQQSQVSVDQPVALVTTPEESTSISMVAIDNTSLDSIIKFIRESKTVRTGVLFGTVGEDGFTVIVDAIYECAQDNVTGEPLHDVRLPMVIRMGKLMDIWPVGILTTRLDPGSTPMVAASDLVRVLGLNAAKAWVIVTISSDFTASAMIATPLARTHYLNGTLHNDTALSGQTVRGGLDGKTLYKPLAVVTRKINTIIHTGFYRLNRSNHTPTFEDAAAFLVARRDIAKIPELHVQVADYHLVLFIADALGESSAERIILAIYQEEDDLVEDLVELLLSAGGDLSETT